MIHPDDPSLVITPPNPPEERGKRANNLITSFTLSASFAAVGIAVIIVAMLTTRIVVGNLEFRLGWLYLWCVIAYISLIIGLMVLYAMNLELPPWKKKWDIEEDISVHDPYDKVDWR